MFINQIYKTLTDKGVKPDSDAEYDENHNAEQISEDDDIVILEDAEENEAV